MTEMTKGSFYPPAWLSEVAAVWGFVFPFSLGSLLVSVQIWPLPSSCSSLRSASPPARVAQPHPSVSKSLFHVGWPLNLCFSRMHSWWIPSIYLPIHLLSLWLHLAWFYPVYWLFLLQWSSFLSPGFWFSSVQSLNYVYLWPHGLQHARLPCPSPTPRACSNSCPSSRWCHPTISSSVVPFSPCPQSFPASGSFPNASALHIRRDRKSVV